MVRSQIKKKSKIILVIDQPSAEDDSNNKLMTDKMMKMVGSYLAQANIHLSSISIIPVVKERHNKLKNISVLEKTAWKALLEREINTIPEVNLILCLGELATEMLTGKSNHDKYRGSIMPCELRECKTLVLWNPTHASDPKTPWLTVYMARPEWKPFMSWDCQKAKRHKDTSEYLHPGCEIIVTEDLVLLEEEFLSEEYINNNESMLACDIEASYAEMTCIGFAKDETKAYVIPLVHMNGKKLSQALKLTDRILSSPVKKIFQNGNFDLTFLAHYYKIKVNNFWWDTMLCFHSMFPNLPKGLGVLGSLFTETPYWKDMAKGEDDKQWMMPHHKVDWPTFFRYNGEDTANLITIQKNQQPLLDSRGTHEVFQREMNLCYPLITSEVMGTNIDLSIKASLRDKLENEIRKWELFFHHLCMENAPNINSPKQLKEFLYEKLRLPTRVKKGSVTADVDALTSLIRFNPIVIKPIMILRILKKQRSFCDITTAEDGRVRTTFKPAGTQTGRLSSSKSLTGVGSNLQQIPKIAKAFYIPDDGKVLVQADYSKAESWIVAALAEDEKMIEALYSEDFHSTNATNILGYKVTKANYSDRQLGKRISHGCCDGETEVLTPAGWIRFDKLEDNTPVAQWDADTHKIDFVIPSIVTRDYYRGDMIHLQGQSYDMFVTPNHRIGFYTWDNKYRIETAEEFINRKSARIPLTGYLEENEYDQYDSNFLRLCVAIIADGSINKSRAVQFRLKKDRKIQRIMALLDKLKYTYTYNIDSDKACRIYIGGAQCDSVIDLITKEKLFGAWLLELNAKNLDAILEEVTFWDGHVYNNGTNRKECFSTCKENIDWIQIISHLRNKQCLVTVNEREYPRCDFYTASFNRRTRTRLENLNKIEKVLYEGIVYCVTVPKDNFLSRRNGKISIGPNSNYGMTAFLLQSVLAKEGYAFNKKETEELMEMYFNNYPGVRHNYHNWIKDCLSANMTLENPFGRKTTFFDQWGNRLFNKAFAWIPQSTIGDMAGQAWINTYNKMGHYVDIMIQVHDSLIMQVDREDLTQDFVDELTSCMVIPLDIKGTHIEVPIDVEVGHNWKDLIEWDVKLSGGRTECGKCGKDILIGEIVEDKEHGFICKECPE